MNRRYVTLIILSVTTIVFLAAAVPSIAAEKSERPRRDFRMGQMPDEMVERMLNQISERDPAKAKELKELREKDPERFMAEFRKTLREHRERFPGQRVSRGTREGRGERGGRRGAGREMRMRERYAEHFEWLEKNYPEEAQKLTELQKENPELYMKRMAISFRRYREIREAERENPKLAEILKQDLELKGQRNRLVRKIRAEKNEDEKNKMAKELEEILNKRFDLILQRKQIAYEQLSEKLEKLKEEVKKSKESIEKWNAPKLKDEKVKTRLKELVTGEGKFRWE